MKHNNLSCNAILKDMIIGVSNMMVKPLRLIFLTSIFVFALLFDYTVIQSESVFRLVNFLVFIFTSLIVMLLHKNKHPMRKKIYFLLEYTIIFFLIYILASTNDKLSVFTVIWFLYMVYAVLLELFEDIKLLLLGCISSIVIFGIVWILNYGVPKVNVIDFFTGLICLNYLSLVFRVSYKSKS